MKPEIRTKYIKSFPSLKTLLYKAEKSSSYDKGRASWLVEQVENQGKQVLSNVEKSLVMPTDMQSAVDFLKSTLDEKIIQYHASVSEYLDCSKKSSIDKSCEKYEQRNREVAEELAVDFYLYLLHIKEVIKSKDYIKFYNDEKGIADLTPKNQKHCFDIDQDSISKYIIDPHWWSDTSTLYTERGIKRYITQQSKEPLSSRDKEWLMGKYYVAHVDLTNADLHKIYLTQLKAKMFKEYWGFEEVEENYYEFDIPLTEHTDVLPARIYFQTYPGVSSEFTAFYYEGDDGWGRMISPTTIKNFNPNFDSLMSDITRFHTQGYIEAGKIKVVNDQKVSAPKMRCTHDLHEEVEFMGELYENKIPYLYTYQKLQEKRELEQDRVKDEKKARAKETLIKNFMYWTGLHRYEVDTLYREYERYLILNKQGKMPGAPRSMNFDRYFQWRERGAPRYERKHTSYTTKQKERKVDADVDAPARNKYIYTY